ncbi:MAG: PAC2 family protein [Nanoarchaeota archaeon]|nr:PAC2 family protein [Nanoarchaeota archaeon]
MTWTIDKIARIPTGNSILIEGLPGVGNVGKIAVEYLIDKLKAKKIYELRSNDLPHYVFVNEKNIIELPSIDIYTTKVNGNNILLISGDIQPTSEVSCHNFCNKILDTFEKSKGKEIITIGGIALQEVPSNPGMYFTANSIKMLKKYSAGAKTKRELHEFIGPILGVTGLLPGLAGKRNIPAITILAETFESPRYIGINGARKIIKHLNKKLNLNLKNNKIDKELENSNLDIEDFEEEIFKEEQKVQKPKEDSLNYIG